MWTGDWEWYLFELKQLRSTAITTAEPHHMICMAYDMGISWPVQFEIRKIAQLTFRCFFFTRQKNVDTRQCARKCLEERGKEYACNLQHYHLFRQPTFFLSDFCFVSFFFLRSLCLVINFDILPRTHWTHHFRRVILFCCCFFCFLSFHHIYFDFVPGNSCWTK